MLDFSRNVTFLGQGSISEIPVFLGSDPCLSLFCRNETRNDPVSATTKKSPIWILEIVFELAEKKSGIRFFFYIFFFSFPINNHSSLKV